MDRIDANIGYRTIEDDNVKYFGGKVANGKCYKNIDAWYLGGIVYISNADLEFVNGDVDIEDHSWTAEQWIKYVKDYILEQTNFIDDVEDSRVANEMVRFIAYNSFLLCTNDDLTKYLSKWMFEKDKDGILTFCKWVVYNGFA